MVQQPQHLSPITLQLIRASGYLGSFALVGIAVYALVMNAAFYESLTTARISVVFMVLIMFHLMRYPELLLSREFVLYASFLIYMFIELLWTDNLQLVKNTLVPAFNFFLILILFGSVVTFHRTHVVVAGAFTGFLAGALTYTSITGFPLSYPADFSYNAVALMYLFGLFVTLLLACYTRSKALLLIVALLVMAHIVATTSIKTNLGVALGVIAAGLVYFREFATLVRQNFIPLLVLLGVLGYLAASNDALMGSLERGANRVSIGINVLQSREEISGYGGFERRDTWQEDGLNGWKQNPIFGNGVESFRAKFGITSHSTPIDLLHNSGLIGLVLFYSVFASLAWRLIVEARSSPRNIRFLIFASLICFLFITLSGTMHYNAFLAAFIAIGVAILRKHHGRTEGSGTLSRDSQL